MCANLDDEYNNAFQSTYVCCSYSIASTTASWSRISQWIRMKQACMNMNRVTGCCDVGACAWMECTVSKETFSVFGLRWSAI